MRPRSAQPYKVGNKIPTNQVSADNGHLERPSSSGSFTTKTRILRNDSTAYQNWLRRSNEFSSTPNIRNHPRDYKSVQTFNLRSGCRVTKSSSQLQVRIDPDEFFQTEVPKPREPVINVKAMEVLIQGLQEEVRYLTVYLEEEKLHHAGTKKRALVDAEKLKSEMEKIKKEEIEKVMNKHTEHVEELKIEHGQQLEDLEEDLKRQYNKLENEYKMLQAAFKTYRTKIADDMEEKWKDKRKEFEWEKQRALDNAVDNTRRAMEERFNKERVSIRNEYKELMQQMVSDQRKEMEDFMRKMSDGKSSVEELKAKAEQAEKFEAALKVSQDQLSTAKRDMKKISHELNETQAKLSIYEQKFEEKVSAVEDKYRKRIDDLVHEVSDFRILLIKKAETLYDERAAADELQKKWTIFAKEKLEQKLFQKTGKVGEVKNLPSEDMNPSLEHVDSKKNEIPETKNDVEIEDLDDDSSSSTLKTNAKCKRPNGITSTTSKLTDMNSSSAQKSSFNLPPRKKASAKNTEVSETKTKNIGITKAGPDKIRPRLPMSTVSLLDSANLPYVDSSEGAGVSTSRPQSPDVIF